MNVMRQQDLNTQAALKIAKDCDPSQSRTKGNPKYRFDQTADDSRPYKGRSSSNKGPQLLA